MKRLAYTLSLCLALLGAGGFIAGRALVHGDSSQPIPKDVVSYRDVVKRVLPAVVSIEARPKAVSSNKTARSHPFDNIPGLPPELRKQLEQFQAPPSSGKAFGSGFVVDPAGIILTNDHVVRGADTVEVMLHDGRKFISKEIKHDPKTDLAIVRIDAKGSLPALKLGDSEAMEIGDRVLAVGAPLGMTGTVTAGIISAKGRDVHLNMYEDFLQTDAAINPGNSGGPLVNLAGEVIGMNSAIRSGTGGNQGIGFAISSKMIKDVMDQLLKSDHVQRGYLGVQMQPLDPQIAGRLGMSDKNGVVASKIVPGSPAAKAGLQDGDILVELAGQPVSDPRRLQRIVAGLPIGKAVEVVVFRDGARKTLNLTVEEQPASFDMTADTPQAGPTPLGKMGLKIMDLTPEKAKQFNLPEAMKGVLIAEVDAGSAADEAGLRSGMVILKVDQERVKSAAEVAAAVAKAAPENGVVIQVRSPQGGVSYILLKTA